MHTIEALWSLSGTDAVFFTEQTDGRQTTDTQQTDITDCLTPLCACARWVKMWCSRRMSSSPGLDPPPAFCLFSSIYTY